MENQITTETTSFQVPPSQAVNTEPIKTQMSKPNIFLIVLLSVLLIISIGITGFFAYQTQNLVKELTMLKSGPTSTPEATVGPTATPDPAADWKIYSDKNGSFSFKYPADWFLWNSLDGDSVLLDESSFDPNLIVEPDQVEITFTTTASKELVDPYLNNFTQTSQFKTGNNVIFNIMDTSLGPKEDGPASQYLFAQTVVSNNLYRFGLTKTTYKSVFDQILSTFKFTN